MSGSTFILNKKTVGLILENQEYWDHEYWDDVALSLLLSKLNISPQVSDRFDVEGNPFKQKYPQITTNIDVEQIIIMGIQGILSRIL